MKKQVNKKHYDFETYVTKARFMSFWYQINYIYKIKPKKILEIGAGNQIVKKIVEENFNYKVLDIDSELKPDIIGSVLDMPIKDNSFDLILCCQVLEHLPFEKFEESLKEISRVAKDKILISLPYANIYSYLQIKLPLLKKIYFSFTLPRLYEKHIFVKEHYWEIGKRGYPMKRITKVMKKYFNILEINNPHENKYHVFFLLEKKTRNSN